MDQQQAWLILSRAPGLGSVTTRKLLQRFTTPEAVVEAGRSDLIAAGLPTVAVDAIVKPDTERLALDQRWLEDERHDLIWIGHPRYPELLARSPGAPAWLYTRGDISLLGEPQLAIVGSRVPTPTGAETAEAFARYLAQAGLVITSGMAEGIDTAAHQGALAAPGPTIAVCGTGLDRVFPRSAGPLAKRIAAAGLLVSEFPPGVGARREHFPQRNRIIAGLSVGTLVVEAAQRSGSLITAHRAIEAGREVFAIPGSIHNLLARGCHRLIREGARLVESGHDILSELAPLLDIVLAEPPPTPEIAETEASSLGEDYLSLLETVGFEPTQTDTIVRRSGLTTQEVSSMLLILELQGYIKPSSQGGYTRTTMRPKE